MDTTNLRQVKGGTVIKQTDRSSVLSFILQDAKGREQNLDGQSAQVDLYTSQGKYWETTTIVKGSEVSFSLPGNLAVDDYLLDIHVAGYVFPSDRNLIIRVTQGFKNLPDKETAEKSERTLEEIIEDIQEQSGITAAKDQALQEIDSKAQTISDAIKADMADLLQEKADKSYVGSEINSIKNEIASSLEVRLKRLESALYEDITGNPFIITFNDINGLNLTNGVFNESKVRLEC